MVIVVSAGMGVTNTALAIIDYVMYMSAVFFLGHCVGGIYTRCYGPSLCIMVHFHKPQTSLSNLGRQPFV